MRPPPESATNSGQKNLPVRKAILAGSGKIQCLFAYDTAVINAIKTVAGRVWDPLMRSWYLPLNLEAVEKLLELDFELEPKITEWAKLNSLTVADMPTFFDQTPYKKTLRPFQIQGVQFTEKCEGRVLLADQMGLGKTIQALAWLYSTQCGFPALVVCPATLKLNWEREIKNFLPDKVTSLVLSGLPKTNDWYNDEDIVIANYDIMRDSFHRADGKSGKFDCKCGAEIIIRKKVEVCPACSLRWQIDKKFKAKALKTTGWAKLFSPVPFQTIIMDEAHHLKSKDSSKTTAVLAVAKRIPQRIALSGTPIVNRPIEVFNALQLVAPHIFPNKQAFAHRYCDAKHDGFGWNFNGHSNEEELHRKLQSVMIRRLKSEVLPQLPAKSRSIVPLEITNRTQYNKAEKDVLKWLKENRGDAVAAKASGAAALVKMEVLKRLTLEGKLKSVVSWIDDFLEQSEDKLLVFTTHKSAIAELYEKYKKISVRIEGSVSAINRQKNQDAFQNDPKIRLLLGNIQAAGVGLTLTAAPAVAFVELPWTPGDVDQAEDRVHRIGQERPVNIYYLVAENTIDQDIAELLDEKRKVIDSIIDGTATESTSLIGDLMKRLRGRK